ncbi:MAG: type II secretion system F family protein [Phycisphaerales bacterium]
MPPLLPSSDRGDIAVRGGQISFAYVAATPDGRRKMGVIQARDTRHLNEQLRRNRLVPLQTWSLPAWLGTGASKVSLKDQAELHTQLAQLLTRGVPLVEALEVTASAVASGTRPRVERMRDMVAAGSSFSEAAFAVQVFDPVTIAVYRAAERTGDLGGAAKQLSITVRRQLQLGNKVITLLLYPMIVVTISILVALIIITFIVPRIVGALEGAQVQLPFITRAMADTGLFIQAQWPWLLVAFAGLLVGAFVTRKRIAEGVAWVSRRLPILKTVVLTQESARFFTVMAAMTRSGITLGDALGVASGAISHPVLKEELGTLRTRLIEGGILRQLIDNVTSLPLPTRRLLIAAERSGDLESAFGTLADDMTDELDRNTARLLAVLEPLMIVMMFLFIGSMLLSIMIPMMQAATNVG